MSQERITVLEMLKDGKISTDEAIRLLEGLDRSKENHHNHNNRHHHRMYGNRFHGNEFDSGWINDLKDSIVESVHNVTSQLDSSFSAPLDFGRSMLVFTDSIENCGEFINSVNLQGKNAMIEIIASEGDDMLIEAFFKPKGHQDPYVSFEKNNGNYSLIYNYNAVHSMRIRLKVPKIKIDNLHLETKNSSIYVREANVGTGTMITKNAQIQLDNMKASYLNIDTRNAAVYINNTESLDIEIKTSNAHICASSINCENINAYTSNAQIKLFSSNIRRIQAKTTNSSISLENMHDITKTQNAIYSAELSTTNGSIVINYENSANIGIKINAGTTSGKIECVRNDLSFGVLDKNYMDATSIGYDEALHKLTIKAQTTSGNIRIK